MTILKIIHFNRFLLMVVIVSLCADLNNVFVFSDDWIWKWTENFDNNSLKKNSWNIYDFIDGMQISNKFIIVVICI
jgi:hypothetical protein